MPDYDILEDNFEDLRFFGDEILLAECWLSEEDEKAFAYLQ
jgi:hypothetical protein